MPRSKRRTARRFRCAQLVLDDLLRSRAVPACCSLCRLVGMTAEQRRSRDESAWPLLPAERTWGAARLTLTLATTAAATWCYLIGESVGSYLGFIQGGVALGAGCMIGMLLVLLAAGPACVRFGIDSVAATKPQFGSRGWVVPAALQAISIIGWNSLLIIFFAKSAVQLCVRSASCRIGHAARRWCRC